MRINRGPWALLLGVLLGSPLPAAELPGDYFKLMEAEIKPLLAENEPKHNPGAMFAAAVLYAKQHPANPSFRDKKKLELALALGDLYARQSEQDAAENKQDYEWEIHFWLDTYRLLEAELGRERRERWRKEIVKIVSWFARETAGRIDFPRYQGPYLRTSTNHLALFASTVYLAGRVLPNADWEKLGGRALHRLAAEEQTADGYWGEFTDNGPATGYNYLTLCCVALYWEHGHDTAALEALRRATDFHKHFTWPDGTPVETINGRNRHWGVSAWGHFGFTHWPDGRRYAAFLAGKLTSPPNPPLRVGEGGQGGEVSSRDLGRLAQNALYCHEGPTAAIPQELPSSVHRMKVPAGIRKTGPWVVCLSGLIDAPIDSQFTLDRQGHLSIYHEKLGLIVTGANSKHQPELATFLEKTKDRTTTIPLSSRLRMTGEGDLTPQPPSPDRRGGPGGRGDRLGLAYNTFFAEAKVPAPADDQVHFSFAVTETGRGRLADVQLNLQLVLKAGETLETAKTKIVLDEKRVELGPDQIGGWIRHRGWTLKVDPSARLVWPVLPFNPYRNAPETDLKYAIGALSVPVKVQPPPEGGLGGLNWRTGEIAFVLEAKPAAAPEPEECTSPPNPPLRVGDGGRGGEVCEVPPVTGTKGKCATRRPKLLGVILPRRRLEADLVANCLGQRLEDAGVLVQNLAVLNEDGLNASKALIHQGKTRVDPSKTLVNPVVRLVNPAVRVCNLGEDQGLILHQIRLSLKQILLAPGQVRHGLFQAAVPLVSCSCHAEAPAYHLTAWPGTRQCLGSTTVRGADAPKSQTSPPNPPLRVGEGGQTSPPNPPLRVGEGGQTSPPNPPLRVGEGGRTSPPNPPLRVGEGGRTSPPNPPLRVGEGGRGREVAKLAKLAAGMKPGEWAELKTDNLLETHRAKGNSGAIFGYNEGAVWYPKSQQWLYVGGDHNDPARFVTYSAETNAWKIMPQPEWLGQTATHGYDHNALDAARGVFYYRPFSKPVVQRYDIAADQWTALPKLDTPEYLACCVGLAWFPELDGLVWANGGGGKGHVFLFSETTQKWTMLAKDLPMGVYHNFAEYSPVHKVVIFGGGNTPASPPSEGGDTRGVFYKLDAAGKVTPLKKAPVGIGTMQTIVTLDPVSGDFLVFTKAGAFYVYDVVKDEWKLQEGKPPIFEPTRVKDNKVWHVTAAPLSDHGVTMFVKYYHADPPQAWVYLYRHAKR